MTTNLHAHVSTRSVDCDGPLERYYVEKLTDAEIAEHVAAQGVNDFHDLHFKARVLDMHTSFHPADKVVITIRPEGFHMAEDTDEGYRSADVVWCEDECEQDERSQRDYYAEQMGY